LFINDACDVSVDVLKMANFLTLDGLRGFFIVEIAFLQMLVFHFYWRVWEGPGRVLYTTWWRALHMNAFRQSNMIVAIDNRHVLLRYACVERDCNPKLVNDLVGVYLNDGISQNVTSGMWNKEQLPEATPDNTLSWDDDGTQALVAANVNGTLFPSLHTGGVVAEGPPASFFGNPYTWLRWQILCVSAAIVESRHVAKFVHLWLESNLLLQILFMLHMWWWWLMWRILYKLLTGTPREASEDEYEGDEEDEESDATLANEEGSATQNGTEGEAAGQQANGMEAEDEGEEIDADGGNDEQDSSSSSLRQRKAAGNASVHVADPEPMDEGSEVAKMTKKEIGSMTKKDLLAWLDSHKSNHEMTMSNKKGELVDAVLAAQ